MANLETLELTINANAQSATQGIDELTHSLSALSKAVGKSVGGLMRLNRELKTLKGFEKIKLPNIGNVSGASGVSKGSRKGKGTILSEEEAENFAKGQSKLDILRKKQSGTLQDLGKALGADKQNDYRIGSLSERYGKLAQSINEVENAASKDDVKQFVDNFDRAKLNSTELNGVLKQIGDEISKGSAMSDAKISSLMKKYYKLTDAINGANAAAKKAKGMAGVYDPEHNNGRGFIPGAPTAEEMKKDAEWREKFNQRAEEAHQRDVEYLEKAKQRRQELADASKNRAKAEAELAKAQREGFNKAVQAERAAMERRGEDTKAIIEQSTQLDLLRLKQDALKMETISLAKEGKLSSKQIAERSIQYQKIGDQIKKIEDQMSTAKEATKGLEGQTNVSAKVMSASIKGVTKSAGGLLSSIGRIFKTMLIRTAIRQLLKAAKEGLDNYYQYSKRLNGTFANAMDDVYKKWTQIKNQIGAGIGTALNAILPVLKVVGDAVQFVLETFTALFALLSGKTTYSQATTGMQDYGDAIASAGKTAKQWLGSFDELNVMTQESSGSGVNAANNFKDMFQEVELPAWMIEWKPLIEAILAGVLGATILPKIWDWVKKIFGLFSGDVAEKAIDFVSDLLGKNGTHTLPDIGKQATDMVVFGGGAAAAAAALPTVSAEIEKIVAALDGVSALESLVGLIGELLTKAFAAIPVPFKLDTKEYDEFKKKHEEWIDDIDEKKVNIVINEDEATVTKLDTWTAVPSTKVINVLIGYDASTIVGLDLFADTEKTKKINVSINYSSYDIDAISAWVATPETKTITVSVTGYSSDISAVDAWAGTAKKKSITVDIDDSGAMELIDAWADTTAAKTINLSFNDSNVIKLLTDWLAVTEQKKIELKLYDNNVLTLLADWLKADDTKYIGLKFYDNNAIKLLSEWIDEDDTKYIGLKFYDNNAIKLLAEWIDTDETKYIGLKFTDDGAISVLDDWLDVADEKTISLVLDGVEDLLVIEEWAAETLNKLINISFESQAYSTFVEQVRIIDEWIDTVGEKSVKLKMDNGTGGSGGTEDNKTFWDDFWGTPAWELNGDFFEGIKNSIEQWFKDSDPVEVNVTELVSFEGFADLTEQGRKDFVTSIFNAFGSEAAINELKKKIPNISVDGIIKLTNWEEFSDEQALEFVTALKDAFGAKEAKEAAEAAGIDVGKLVQQGMESQNPKVKKQAESWNGIIKKEVDDKTHTTEAKLGYDEKANKTTADKLAALAENREAKMQSNLTYDTKANTTTSNNLAKLVTEQKPEMKSALTYDEKSNTTTRNKLAKLVTDNKPKMTSALTYVADTAKTTRDKLAAYVTNKKPLMKSELTYNDKTNTKIRNALAKYVTGEKPLMPSGLTYNKDAVIAKRDKMATYVTNPKKPPLMTAGLTYDSKTNKTVSSNLAKIITDKKPEMKSKLTYSEDANTSIRDKLAAIVTDTKPEMSASLGYSADDAQGVADELKDVVEAETPVMTADADITAETLGELKSSVEGVDATIDAGADVTDEVLDGLENEIEGVKPTVNASATFSKEALKKGFAAALTGVTVALATTIGAIALGSLEFKREGGIVSGDIFVANENGVPEMVGSFGGQPAVANTDQIVSGIATGVAAANEEQNALLRQQNTLLRGILEKETSVKIGASSALGRVAKQSLDLYGAMVGG